MNKCAINSGSNTRYTCFTKNNLLDIAKKIKINKNTYSLNKKELYNKLKNTLGNDETKWVLNFSGGKKLKNKVKYLTFKSIGPLHDTEWLSNIQIDNIMYQIIKKNHSNNKYNFVYYETLSSDGFELNKQKINDVKKLLSDGKSVGIVFNTDITRLPGSHWTSVYITPTKASFFDSNGTPPNKHITLFLNKFKRWTYNIKPYQLIDGDCGLWAITFLLKKSIKRNIDDSDTDKTVNKLRNIFFRKVL